MTISICITTYNEEKTISSLLDSLMVQSKKPNEIIIVDSESTDKTSEIIRHYQQKDGRIKIFVHKCSRSKGRNMAIEIAHGDVICITDAGCIADKDWVKNITAPFKNKEVDMVAGFYRMTGDSLLQRTESFFLGVLPGNFNIQFLPSTRSVAFRKELWERVGGFPENLSGTAEDTVFNYEVIKSNAKIARVKNATVEWSMPKSLDEFFNKIKNYAKGDAESKVWWNSYQGLASHNIKVILVFVRYFVVLSLFFYSLFYSEYLSLLIALVIFYLIWAFRKVYAEFGNVGAGVIGVVLQIASDLAVMKGFSQGLKKRTLLTNML